MLRSKRKNEIFARDRSCQGSGFSLGLEAEAGKACNAFVFTKKFYEGMSFKNGRSLPFFLFKSFS